MNDTNKTYIDGLDVSLISEERRIQLHNVIDYILSKWSAKQAVHLNYICTHNSRRSQFAQVWSHTIAAYYNIPISSYSGGVEITACNERTIASLQRTGFMVTQEGQINPKYSVSYGREKVITLFSKLFDDPVNPTQNFAALMTCSDADDNCPFIPGCEQRISLNYEDPKAYDNTKLEEHMYDERSRQIATEIKYIITKVLAR